MALVVGIGQSKTPSSFSAAREAAASALRGLRGEKPDLVFGFISSYFNPERVKEGLFSVLGEVPFIGTSTSGEITSLGPQRRSILIVAIKSEKLQFALGSGDSLSRDSRAAGHKAALFSSRNFNIQRGGGELKRRVFLIFPDGLRGNCADALRGIQEILGRSFPIVGGSSGDDFLFQKTYQYNNNLISTDSMVAVLLGGDLTFGIGSRHGWRPLGKPRKVTRALSNIIYEIDHQPAVNIYEEYFGQDVMELKKEPLASMAILYPLGMAIPGEEEYLLRNPLSVGEDGSLICAAEVPEGQEIRLMIGNKASALEAAAGAAQTALKNLLGAKARLVFIFSSISRDKLLGRQTSLEITTVKEIFGEAIPVVGFYTYGEQAPLTSEINIGQAYFQNASLVVLAWGE